MGNINAIQEGRDYVVSAAIATSLAVTIGRTFVAFHYATMEQSISWCIVATLVNAVAYNLGKNLIPQNEHDPKLGTVTKGASIAAFNAAFYMSARCQKHVFHITSYTLSAAMILSTITYCALKIALHFLHNKEVVDNPPLPVPQPVPNLSNNILQRVAVGQPSQPNQPIVAPNVNKHPTSNSPILSKLTFSVIDNYVPSSEEKDRRLPKAASSPQTLSRNENKSNLHRSVASSTPQSSVLLGGVKEQGNFVSNSTGNIKIFLGQKGDLLNEWIALGGENSESEVQTIDQATTPRTDSSIDSNSGNIEQTSSHIDKEDIPPKTDSGSGSDSNHKVNTPHQAEEITPTTDSGTDSFGEFITVHHSESESETNV